MGSRQGLGQGLGYNNYNNFFTQKELTKNIKMFIFCESIHPVQ